MANVIEATLEAAPDRLLERNFATVLLWVVVALTVSLLLWAGLAKVQEVVHATGSVVPSSRLQVVSNLEGGIVKAILVRAGDKVSAGQPLLRLDATATSADFARGDTSIEALLARAARLEAEARGRPLLFPAGLEISVPTLVANERALYNAQIASIATEREIARSRLLQAERAAGQARAEAESQGEALAQARREVEILEPLVEKGVEPAMSLVRARSAERQATSAREAAAEALRRSEAARREAEASIRSLEQRFRAQASDALASTRSEIAAQSASLPALADRMQRTEVRAPVAGVVGRVLATTVGGSIRPGEPLVEVVPAGDSLVIEARVSPADIAFVRLGQGANVKISAYDYSVYGTLPGVVERIAPDAVTDERTGLSHFLIQVRTRASALTGEDGAKLPIGAGMIADVDVLGRDRSVLSYILTPVTRLRDNAFREKL
ncbi:HlyD family type I secretion periplasmic adaptor subunit [Polymorphobacter multimanifer]|uniref:Membrane fusion protein (MFP) family protein n=1 Tax=Polymorphobacter multimanifer TaxID=1070431 RepID=A0A841L6Q6_9SPHN|nr:HlyD family type I secretion periplasmic adaptor subunit [Polymorphobacter multimanifer]MBB6228284.1 adhesin transport system membrane fusion protein [Polymorphobacter multimanifer]GGI83387.1 HlyD family type I secretion periplasmic adaptor subunit [Polymorphobacter multimanifer]